MARTKKVQDATDTVSNEKPVKAPKAKTLTPKPNDTIIIDASYCRELTFELRNLEVVDGKIVLGQNTANAIVVIETIYNTLVNAVDPEYPQSDFLKVYKDAQETREVGNTETK